MAARWTELTHVALGDDLMDSLIVEGLNDRVTNSDDFIDGILCRNDRDYPYDRP